MSWDLINEIYEKHVFLRDGLWYRKSRHSRMLWNSEWDAEAIEQAILDGRDPCGIDPFYGEEISEGMGLFGD